MAYQTINVNGFVVPKSKKDAIEKMIEGIEKGAIRPEATCKNKNNAGEMCVIGYMFTEHQMRILEEDGELSSSVAALSWCYGEHNIEAMIGMTIREANEIQNHFDHESEMFLEHLKLGWKVDIDTFNKNLIKFLKEQSKQ